MFRVRPWWLFWLGEGRWITLAPHIYHPKGVLPESRPALVAHEEVHLEQQRGHLFRWLLRYVFSRRFRLEQEAEGVVAEMEAIGPLFREGVRHFYAGQLSSFPYLWAARSRAEALRAIREAEDRLYSD